MRIDQTTRKDIDRLVVSEIEILRKVLHPLTIRVKGFDEEAHRFGCVSGSPFLPGFFEFYTFCESWTQRWSSKRYRMWPDPYLPGYHSQFVVPTRSYCQKMWTYFESLLCSNYLVECMLLLGLLGLQKSLGSRHHVSFRRKVTMLCLWHNLMMFSVRVQEKSNKIRTMTPGKKLRRSSDFLRWLNSRDFGVVGDAG